MNCRCCGRTPEQVTLAASRAGLSGFVCRTRRRALWRGVTDEICFFCFVWYGRAVRAIA